MGEAEDIAAKIGELGEAIKAAKAEKKPKEEWEGILKDMLAQKAKYKEVTGNDFGPPKQEKKNKDNQEQQGPSEKNAAKNAAKKAAKEQRQKEKDAKRAERERLQKEKADRLAGVGQDNFGDMPLVQSQEITDKIWTKVEQLKPTMAGQEVLVRGHLQTTRGVGKGVFCVVRSSLYSVQGVAFESKDGAISSVMIKYIDALPSESVVDMKGKVTVPEKPVDSVTQKEVEIQISSFHCVCKATQALPFQMEDACRPDTGEETDVGAYNEDEEVVPDDGLVHVGQKMRLDYRWLDLRTPANQSIFRIESNVGLLFRECLIRKGFVEIHSPKLIGGASEGGSDVFTLDYFGQPACLAMSPQLHKQITCACSGFERVFTTGPVFRAENSNTRRHLCEFTGFDLEMVIHEHYDEVLDLFSDLFIHIFDGLNERCKAEIERVREQHPFEDLQYLRPTLKLTYAEGCALLREAGVNQGDYEDLSTENEKKLGDIVKKKYGTDFFFMDKYPLEVRPFYTMPDPKNPKLSNSYDFFIRGQEILSGAQRVHDPNMIEERAKAHGIDLKDIESYVNSFRHGALPHGGGGIGLERVVMLFLGLPNIRKAAWFPRDPKRITP
ncbi:Asparagine--tRNA ligase [Seminavis robusta]|uniref:aspartate--tRNA ligase n=1 Tax=Seminavis robusta TaxID=568900 RepID=A0A9N8EGN8_9STRA|nr:Asparagine--tRNA ligase [Seminavis robusta]|eukprot:Sro1100_g241300.1 Asparagine--tRNA ligase (609) ;mRNA; r:25239-27189